MRILFLGDIVGRSGRDAVESRLPGLRRQLKLDFVVANGENAAAGFGITRKICDQLFAAGNDVDTGGEELVADLAGDAEASGRILTVGDDEI